jgi:hypothetical protein
VHLGRPLAALAEADGATQVLTATGTWWSEPAGTAARLLVLPDGRAELTRWKGSVEITRTVSELLH